MEVDKSIVSTIHNNSCRMARKSGKVLNGFDPNPSSFGMKKTEASGLTACNVTIATSKHLANNSTSNFHSENLL